MQVSCDEALESNPDSYILHESGENSVGKALRHSRKVIVMIWEHFLLYGLHLVGSRRAPHGL